MSRRSPLANTAPRTLPRNASRVAGQVVVAVTSLVLGTALATLPLAASAALALDPSRSSVTLLSIKVLADGTSSVTERHAFTELVGRVDDDGAASVSIPLAAIETGVPIRNERMSEFLFETGTYPEATIEATVPAAALESGTHQLELEATLDLHGERQTILVPVSVDRDVGAVTVTAIEPVLLDAAAHDLAGGIGKLAELAGAPAHSHDDSGLVLPDLRRQRQLTETSRVGLAFLGRPDVERLRDDALRCVRHGDRQSSPA